MQISPEKSNKPDRQFSKVVLPHPEGPYIATSPFLGKEKLMSFKMISFPNCFCNLLTLIIHLQAPF